MRPWLAINPRALRNTPGPPGVSAGYPTLMVTSAGSLNADISAGGLSTTAYFEWGTTTAFGNTTGVQNIGQSYGAHRVSAAISGLSPNTTYYFRARATNADGEAIGLTGTLTTRSSGWAPSWNGDFSTRDFSQYDPFDGRAQDFKIVTSPAPPQVPYSAQMTVTNQSQVGETGQRAFAYLQPVDAPYSNGKSQAYQGAETWYRDRLYVPSGFVTDPDTDWNYVWQLHNWPDLYGAVNVVMGIVEDSSDGGGPHNSHRLSLRIIGGASPAHPVDLLDGSGNPLYVSSTYTNNPDIQTTWIVGQNPVARDAWIDTLIHIKWDWRTVANGGSPLLEWYINGTLAGSTTQPNLFYNQALSGPGQCYQSTGYYRSNDMAVSAPQSLYHGDTQIGPTRTGVGG